MQTIVFYERMKDCLYRFIYRTQPLKLIDPFMPVENLVGPAEVVTVAEFLSN